MLLYDLYYYDAKTGVRLAEFDSGTRGPKKASKGEYTHAVCTNGGSCESYWCDVKGMCEPPKNVKE